MSTNKNTNEKSGQETTTINIPSELHHQIQHRLSITDFETVEEYVTFVLSEVVKEDEPSKSDKTELSSEEEAAIKNRLRDMGYMD